MRNLIAISLLSLILSACGTTGNMSTRMSRMSARDQAQFLREYPEVGRMLELEAANAKAAAMTSMAMHQMQMKAYEGASEDFGKAADGLINVFGNPFKDERRGFNNVIVVPQDKFGF